MSGRRRAARREHIFSDVVDAVSSLNAMYGCRPRPGLSTRTPAQANVHSLLFDSVARGRPQHVLCSREAARELLGQEIEYSGQTSKVVPFSSGTVSLPRGLKEPVDLPAVLGSIFSPMLAPNYLLRDPVEAAQVLKEDDVHPYLDADFRNNPDVYDAFIAELVRLGLVGWTHQAREKVTPFFVEKKSKQLRVVWDCRRSNAHFEPPPGMDMGWRFSGSARGADDRAALHGPGRCLQLLLSD